MAGGVARGSRSSCTRCGRSARRTCTRPTSSRSWSAAIRSAATSSITPSALLKEEMRRLGSVVMRAAEASRGAGGRGARGRPPRFSGEVTASIADHPRIAIVREEVTPFPRGLDGPGDRRHRAADIRRAVGRHCRAGRGRPSLLLRRDQPDSPLRDASIVRRSSAPRAGAAACAGRRRTGTRRRRPGRTGLRRGRRGRRLPELPVHRRGVSSGSTTRS